MYTINMHATILLENWQSCSFQHGNEGFRNLRDSATLILVIWKEKHMGEPLVDSENSNEVRMNMKSQDSYTYQLEMKTKPRATSNIKFQFVCS